MENEYKGILLKGFIGSAVGVFSLHRYTRSFRVKNWVNRNFTYRVSGGPWFTPLTYSLNHGSWRHLGINMAMMWMLGSQLVEKPFVDTKQFAWLMGGSALGATLLERSKLHPMIGASGIVFGLLGSLAVLEPSKTWLLLFPIPGLPITNMQLVEASVITHVFMLMHQRRVGTSVALLGHLGGLFSGMLLSHLIWQTAISRNDLMDSLDSWSRSFSSAALVFHWLVLTAQLAWSLSDETEKGNIRSKKRFIERTWKQDFY